MTYEVQTLFTYGFENCWTDGNGQPVTYASKKEAMQAINDHIEDCKEAFKAGDMIDYSSPDDFKIVKL